MLRLGEPLPKKDLSCTQKPGHIALRPQFPTDSWLQPFLELGHAFCILNFPTLVEHRQYYRSGQKCLNVCFDILPVCDGKLVELHRNFSTRKLFCYSLTHFECPSPRRVQKKD